jgi:hypothetical protein
MSFSYLKPYCNWFTTMVSTFCCVQMFIICMDNHHVQIKLWSNHTHTRDYLTNYFLLSPCLNKLFNLGAKSFFFAFNFTTHFASNLLHLTICSYNKFSPWELSVPHILEYLLARDLNKLKWCLLTRGRQCWMKKKMWKKSLESKIVKGEVRTCHKSNTHNL